MHHWNIYTFFEQLKTWYVLHTEIKFTHAKETRTTKSIKNGIIAYIYLYLKLIF